jgi:hypothetical protein
MLTAASINRLRIEDGDDSYHSERSRRELLSDADVKTTMIHTHVLQ